MEKILKNIGLILVGITLVVIGSWFLTFVFPMAVDLIGSFGPLDLQVADVTQGTVIVMGCTALAFHWRLSRQGDME